MHHLHVAIVRTFVAKLPLAFLTVVSLLATVCALVITQSNSLVKYTATECAHKLWLPTLVGVVIVLLQLRLTRKLAITLGAPVQPHAYVFVFRLEVL
uniref:Uncharacterized protein n=1 Tax=Anopheles darlingi TaxID=43151 RepID=A0A2M4D461_ANODA